MKENETEQRSAPFVDVVKIGENAATHSPVEIRKSAREVEQYFSIFGNTDRDMEIVEATAFDKDFADPRSRLNTGKVPVKYNHSLLVGKTKSAGRDSVGAIQVQKYGTDRESDRILGLVADEILQTASFKALARKAPDRDGEGRSVKRIVEAKLLEAGPCDPDLVSNVETRVISVKAAAALASPGAIPGYRIVGPINDDMVLAVKVGGDEAYEDEELVAKAQEIVRDRGRQAFMVGALASIRSRSMVAVSKYSDDQERDERGRWTSGGSSGVPSQVSGKPDRSRIRGMLANRRGDLISGADRAERDRVRARERYLDAPRQISAIERLDRDSDRERDNDYEFALNPDGAGGPPSDSEYFDRSARADRPSGAGTDTDAAVRAMAEQERNPRGEVSQRLAAFMKDRGMAVPVANTFRPDGTARDYNDVRGMLGAKPDYIPSQSEIDEARDARHWLGKKDGEALTPKDLKRFRASQDDRARRLGGYQHSPG